METKLERYDVTFLGHNRTKWSQHYQAESFAHAEEQAYDGAGAKPDEIISITKDYANDRAH